MLTRRALSYSCGVLSRVQHSSRLLLSTASELASSVDGPRVSGTSVHHGMVYEPLVDEKAVETYRRTHQIHMRGRGLVNTAIVCLPCLLYLMYLQYCGVFGLICCRVSMVNIVCRLNFLLSHPLKPHNSIPIFIGLLNKHNTQNLRQFRHSHGRWH